ncbi:LysM peptidoglycan-binding domain-containing protein [Melittangium boletus]|nr:LysM domain-containing protein [Melittangium boletus]
MKLIEYRVSSGDTLSTIARRHNVQVEVLSRLNSLSDLHRL